MTGRMDMKRKPVDCVRMKRHEAEQVMKQLEGKSLREQREYWQKGSEDLKKLQQRLKKGAGADNVTSAACRSAK